MATDSARGLLSVNELAGYLGIDRSMVYKLVRAGELIPVQVGSRKKFRPEDIEAYLKKGRVA